MISHSGNNTLNRTPTHYSKVPTLVEYQSMAQQPCEKYDTVSRVSHRLVQCNIENNNIVNSGLELVQEQATPDQVARQE